MIVLIDGFSIAFRAFYALPETLMTSKGTPTNVIHGFLSMLNKITTDYKLKQLIVTWDLPGKTFRNEIYTDYKANRSSAPENFNIQIPLLHELLDTFNIPQVSKKGFEADDVLGSLSAALNKQNKQVLIVTGDRDTYQLISNKTKILYTKRGISDVDVVDEKFFIDKFGIKTKQYVEYLALKGDPSDNIPGLPGVGEKTAKKFLAQYGSMENLLENTADLKGKMKEKVEGAKELGILSKELATIMLDVPVDFHEENFKMCMPDIEATKAIFTELEFRRLTDNFVKTFTTATDTTNATTSETSNTTTPTASKPQGNPSGQFDLFAAPGTGNVSEQESVQGYKTIATTDHFYQHVQTPLSRKILLKKLQQQSSVCFDTETTGLKALEVELIGIAFSWEIGKGYYVSFPEDQAETKAILEEFREFFENESIQKIGHNLKYDIKVLSNYEMPVKGSLFDTMIAHYLINPDMRHGMDILSETYLNYQPVSIAELIGKKGKNQLSMRVVPLEDQTEYAVEDADITLQLKEHFINELENGNVTKLFNEIELPLVSVLAAMEIEGINLNTDFLKELSVHLTEDINRLEKNIFEQAGEEFNIASPKQLGIVLFENMKLVDKPKKTKTGQYSTAEDVLSYLAKEHEIIANVLEYRQYKKLQSTYLDALPNEINPKTGRVHTAYAQAVAATGRLSSTNPNLQDIPIRTERGKQVRKAFIPRDENYVLLAADYSQIELRIIAALSEEETMIEAFKNGEDIHASTAAKVFNVPIEEVTREQRSNAKTVNFGIIYGVSAFGLSNQTDLTRKESKELIDLYYETYPKLRSYMSAQVDFARDNGYVETVLQRRRYLKDINSRNAIVRGAAERNAVNAPIQGSAADIIKLAMINIYKRFEKEGFKSKMLLQVHDELVFDAHKDELEIIKPIIKHEMEHAFSMIVPLDVEIGIGENWLEAH